jgi:hypothetical protein
MVDKTMSEKKILPLGTETKWGKIEMVGITGGERYYWMIDKHKVVSMIPALIVEEDNIVKEEL